MTFIGILCSKINKMTEILYKKNKNRIKGFKKSKKIDTLQQCFKVSNFK